MNCYICDKELSPHVSINEKYPECKECQNARAFICAQSGCNEEVVNGNVCRSHFNELIL
jgi:hypothetical protein